MHPIILYVMIAFAVILAMMVFYGLQPYKVKCNHCGNIYKQSMGLLQFNPSFLICPGCKNQGGNYV